MNPQIQKLEDIYNAKGEFPSSWTRYWSLDPGTVVCACLFGVVPPPKEFGNRLIIEDELYVRRMTAPQIAIEIKNKMGNHIYQEFVADWHAMRVTTYNAERSVSDQWVDALESAGVECVATGSSFYPGTDDVQARVNDVREWMSSAGTAGPRLLFVLEKTVDTQNEFRLYKRRVVNRKDVREEPVDKDNHAMNALEYLVGINPTYVEQPVSAASPDPGYLDWERRRKKKKNAQGRGVNLGPPVPA